MVTFDRIDLNMSRILALSLLLPFSVHAQTIWPVSVGGSTIGSPAPYYDPAVLTIDAGDIVRWTNVSGTHNVTGTTEIFPNNPESFNSGNAANGPWNFSFTFNIPGVYSYHCTQDGHAATQTGTINVLNTTGLATIDDAGEISIHPVPAINTLILDLGAMRPQRLGVITLDGRRVISLTGGFSSPVELDVAALAPGNYFVVLCDHNGRVTTKPFTKQ